MSGEGEAAAADQKIWKNLGVRAVSAILFVAFCLAPFYFGGLFWLLLVALMSSRMLWEWVRMTDAVPTPWAFGIAIAGCVMALTYIHLGNASGAIVAMLVAAVLAWIEKSRRNDGLWASLGVLYIVIPALFIVWLRGTTVGFDTSGFRTLFFLIAVVAAADIGAYFGGSYFQGPKIFPKISPKKTWSGFLSGLVSGILIGGIISWFMGPGFYTGVLFAFPVVLFSVLGDLLESAAKRSRNVKDAGGVLPGHGGLLDRLDSLMAVMVAAGLFILIFPNLWPF